MTSIMTRSGRRVDLFNPHPDTIVIEDIAHGLALTNRYGGQTELPYSVAQHSVLVSRMMPEGFRMDALLHDASEAYLGDVQSPLKHSEMMYYYRVLEDKMMSVIANKFLFDYPLYAGVVDADQKVYNTEVRDLFDPTRNLHAFEAALCNDSRIVPWNAKVAEHVFMNEYNEIVENNYTLSMRELIAL